MSYNMSVHDIVTQFRRELQREDRERYDAEEDGGSVLEDAIEDFSIILEKALDRMMEEHYNEVCEECDGWGLDKGDKKCESCRGSGKMYGNGG